LERNRKFKDYLVKGSRNEKNLSKTWGYKIREDFEIARSIHRKNELTDKQKYWMMKNLEDIRTASAEEINKQKWGGRKLRKKKKKFEAKMTKDLLNHEAFTIEASEQMDWSTINRLEEKTILKEK
jgi:hypothetical protein